MLTDKPIGEVIAEARVKAGLSQRQLADLAKVNSSELSKVEKGTRNPSPRMIRRITNYIDLDYNDLMYMIGLGLEVTPLNYFIKHYYSKLNAEELETDEINILGNIEHLENRVAYFEDKLQDKNISEDERELLTRTIKDNKYEINSNKEIVKLIQSLKVKERNKNAKK